MRVSWLPKTFIYPLTIQSWGKCYDCFKPVPWVHWNVYEMETQFVQFIKAYPQTYTENPLEADFFLVPHVMTCISHCADKDEALKYFTAVH